LRKQPNGGITSAAVESGRAGGTHQPRKIAPRLGPPRGVGYMQCSAAEQYVRAGADPALQHRRCGLVIEQARGLEGQRFAPAASDACGVRRL
jgi:hypothetical protein